MYCNQCQYFNQCSYRNQLIPMPYYRSLNWNCQNCCNYYMCQPQMQMPYPPYFTPYNSFMPYTGEIRQEDQGESFSDEEESFHDEALPTYDPPPVPDVEPFFITMQSMKKTVKQCRGRYLTVYPKKGANVPGGGKPFALWVTDYSYDPDTGETDVGGYRNRRKSSYISMSLSDISSVTCGLPRYPEWGNPYGCCK